MLTFLLRELDEILWFWPILENHSWEKSTTQQKILEFWFDDVMLNSLEAPRNWNFVSFRRGWSMYLYSREERDEGKWKRKIICSCLCVALLGLMLSAQIEKSSEPFFSFFLSPILDHYKFSFTIVTTKNLIIV